VVSEGDFLTTVAEEFNQTEEQQRDWLEKILQTDQQTMLVAKLQVRS
jgi:hypothetical protein